MEREETVLVVDDSDFARTLVKTTLEGAGYRVETACDGVEGLERADACSPHAMVIDVSMPRKDGMEMLTELRDNSRWDCVPVLMLSSESVPSMIRRAKEIGATAWLLKPCPPPLLVRAIASLLEPVCEVPTHSGAQVTSKRSVHQRGDMRSEHKGAR